jgi:hypothetical protein
MDWENFFQNYRKPNYVPGYEIVHKLGSGVFGEVYKARKESIGKFYAVKFLRVEDDSLKEAVVRELESLRHFAQVDHPNLVSIEDRGEVDGIPYIIMSYAGEETLKTLLSRGKVPLEKGLALFRQVADGVNALHERSIIHFDLKPANVFIKGEIARVGDYGLSKLVSESRKSLSFGRGTPYYMAPEMLRRRGDHRSDIYSLGVILYEVLTGDVPFKGDTEWEVLKRHETEEVAFPAGVPETCQNAIRKCMAKDPETRYQRVKDVLRDLGLDGYARLGGGLVDPPIEVAAAAAAQVGSAGTPIPVAVKAAGNGVLAGAASGLRRFEQRISGALRPELRGAGGAAAVALPTVGPEGLLAAFFQILWLAFFKIPITVLLTVIRVVVGGLVRIVGFAVALPFRILGVAFRVLLFVFMAGLALYTLSIVFRVLFSVLGSLFGAL